MGRRPRATSGNICYKLKGSEELQKLPVPLHPQSAGSTSGNPSSSSPPSSRDASSFTPLLCTCLMPITMHRSSIGGTQYPLQPHAGLHDSHKLMCLGLSLGCWQQQPAELVSSMGCQVSNNWVTVPHGSDRPSTGDGNSSRWKEGRWELGFSFSH